METRNLVLPYSGFEQLRQQADSCFPAEACGLLAGEKNCIKTVFPVKNIEKNPNRFKMDPEQQLKAFLEIENSAQELLAIYHSHPDGSSRLSEIDRDNFYYPGVFSVLLYLEDREWKIKAFQIMESGIDEINLIFTDIS